MLIQSISSRHLSLILKSILALVLAITSDLVEHLNRRHNDDERAHFEPDETIINGDNKRPPPLEQCHHCGTNASAHCQPTELYPTSNSHYDLIVVSIRQLGIPDGQATQKVQSCSCCGATVCANLGEHPTKSSSGGGGRQPNSDGSLCQQDNDNQEASNESQESCNTVCGQRRTIGATQPKLIPIISHSSRRYSMQREEAALCSNLIKPDCCNTRLQRVHLKPSQQKQHQQKRPKWFSWFPSWSLIGGAEAIRLVRLDAPHSIQAGQQLKLKCLYETRGDKLQSLAWYRNGREFYRFQPFERRQPVLAFNSTGVHVDVAKSRNHTVYLTNTTLETSGRFRCEATGTTFQEAKLETHIEVLPASSSGAEFNCHMTQEMTAFNTLIQIAYILITFIVYQIKL